jgi:hypothetical protein
MNQRAQELQLARQARDDQGDQPDGAQRAESGSDVKALFAPASPKHNA